MIYSVWAEPATQDAKYLLKIIRSLGEKYSAPTFRPHITLYGGVRNMSSVMTAIRNCGARKFSVRTKSLDFSDSVWKTVFVNVERNRQMQKINNAIKEVASNQYDFSPHMSLIYKKMDNSTKQKIINDLKIKGKFTFDKITIIVSSKVVSEWKVVDRLVLK